MRSGDGGLGSVGDVLLNITGQGSLRYAQEKKRKKKRNRLLEVCSTVGIGCVFLPAAAIIQLEILFSAMPPGNGSVDDLLHKTMLCGFALKVAHVGAAYTCVYLTQLLWSTIYKITDKIM